MVRTVEILKDRYRVGEKIATGGMGTVYAATDERLGRPVALKLLDERLAEDPSFVERFRREARSVAALAHPNIARVFDYVEDEQRHFIVMELVQGRDLARLLREEGSLDPERAAAITAQICAALDHAHSAGIVHRDVKPGNVIVGTDDRVKVTDFGIARAIGESKLTVTGAVMGSAHYISPEQANGHDIGPPSDIYSTGIVLYEMVTGAVPFTGESLMAVAARHITDEVPAPSMLNPDVPDHMDAVVARATKKDPRDRFRSAEEMRNALSGSAGAEAGPAATARLDEPASTAVLETSHAVWPIPGDRWDPHRVGRAVLITFALLAVIAAALLFARLGDIDTPERATTGRGPEAPAGFDLPSQGLIGANHRAVTSVLDDHGVDYTVVPVDPEDYDMDLPEGAIVATEPGPGEHVDEGEVVTLFVSAGDEEDDDNNPGKSKGHEKKKEKD